jgi:hypothetical protein
VFESPRSIEENLQKLREERQQTYQIQEVDEEESE